MEPSLKVAIVGRPNVGKSTLFNRLTRSRKALVHDMPGLTHDRIDANVSWMGLEVELSDTAGIEPGGYSNLSERLKDISLSALEQADIGLFVIDGREGLTALDHEIGVAIRKFCKPVILVANKCEGTRLKSEALEAWDLGFGEPVMISAEHNEGMLELKERLEELKNEYGLAVAAEGENFQNQSEEDQSPIKLVIAGRPNTGKSTLINRLLNQERMLTGPEPGLTRDSINIPFSWEGRSFELIDTAGLRKKSRINQDFEKISASSSLRAIRECDAVLLMLDATAMLEKQDNTIANRAVDEGKALIIGANKWDLVDERKETLEELRYQLGKRLSQIPDVPLVTFSVLHQKGLHKIRPVILKTVDKWSRRIPTGQLNRWLSMAVSQNPPPTAQGRRIKFRYATQVASRPPTVALFSNKKEDSIPKSYLRYLLKSFSAHFDLEGVLIRLYIRHKDNPYDPDQT